MIHVELQPEIEAQLAAEANAHGLALDAYIGNLLQAHTAGDPTSNRSAVSRAISRILELREQSVPGASTITELINEGRRF